MLSSDTSIKEIFDRSARMHKHLCPRQVLGVRMGLYAGEMLEIEIPQNDKGLFAIVEMDGCFADGVSVATNCWLGKRTLRHEDLGKVAATFVDTNSGSAIRIAPKNDCRLRAREYSLGESIPWKQMLIGYQSMPSEELFKAEEVELVIDIAKIISRAGIRHNCDRCGEEILNERHIKGNNQILCRSCYSYSYYTTFALTAKQLSKMSVSSSKG